MNEEEVRECPVRHWTRCPTLTDSIHLPCRGCQGCWLDKLIAQCAREYVEGEKK